MAYGSVNVDKMVTSDGISSSGVYGFKNRLINGQMILDQRNAGASKTVVNDTYYLDRWQTPTSLTSAMTIQQVSTAPDGFSNSVLLTSTAASTIGANDYAVLWQKIEGTNFYDLAWGTASAKTISLSFWVRSSITGTFGGFLVNSAQNRAYPFTYTISSANTWEYETITIAGDTSGTWLTTTGAGCLVAFSISCGSSLTGTAGAWVGSQKLGATGQTNLLATNGATMNITGVQFEKGSTATSFDYRPYGTELQLCQRYFESTAFPDATFGITSCRGSAVIGGGGAACGFNFLVPKRTNAPTVTLYSRNGNAGKVSNNATGGDLSGTSSASSIGGTGFLTISMGASLSVGACIEAGWQASAEL